MGKAGVSYFHPKGLYCEDCGTKMQKLANIPQGYGLVNDNYSDYYCKACMKKNSANSEYLCLFCDSKI